MQPSAHLCDNCRAFTPNNGAHESPFRSRRPGLAHTSGGVTALSNAVTAICRGRSQISRAFILNLDRSRHLNFAHARIYTSRLKEAVLSRHFHRLGRHGFGGDNTQAQSGFVALCAIFGWDLRFSSAAAFLQDIGPKHIFHVRQCLLRRLPESLHAAALHSPSGPRRCTVRSTRNDQRSYSVCSPCVVPSCNAQCQHAAPLCRRQTALDVTSRLSQLAASVSSSSSRTTLFSPSVARRTSGFNHSLPGRHISLLLL